MLYTVSEVVCPLPERHTLFTTLPKVVKKVSLGESKSWEKFHLKHIHCTWTRQDATATALVKTNTPPMVGALWDRTSPPYQHPPLASCFSKNGPPILVGGGSSK